MISPHQLTQRHWLKAAGIFLLITSLAALSQAFWIKGKSVVSQHLLQVSWIRTQSSGHAVRPWAWADVKTIAKLSVESLDASFIVLQDASGEAMAFGPGLVAGDPADARSSLIAIGGHRDTHLAFLKDLNIGSLLTLENLAGVTHQYRLTGTKTIDTRFEKVRAISEQPGLLLITCYPFNARQTGGPLRLLAYAEPLDDMNPLPENIALDGL